MQAEPGKKIVFERVLLAKDANNEITVGMPYIAGAQFQRLNI